MMINLSQDDVDDSKALTAYTSSSNKLKIRVKRERWVNDGTWYQVEVNGNALIGFRDRVRAEQFAGKLGYLIRSA